MMTTKKKYKKGAIVALILVAVIYSHHATAQSISNIGENQLVLPAKSQAIRFSWLGDSINGKWEPHTALLLPVKLKNCPKLFYMQFDLGSPYSLFYKNKLLAIRAKYPKTMEPVPGDQLENYSFTIDRMTVLAKQVVIKQFDSTTINWAANSIEIIGTIGADLIDGQVATIDYPHKKLTLSQTIPAKLKDKLRLTDFMYVQRRILLPAKIKDKQTILYFDTGSSMYELLTDKATAESLAVAGRQFVQSKVRSWDKYLTANSIATNDSIAIGGSKIAIRKATFMEGVSNTQAAQMMKMGIGGMTGNMLFLHYTLVLDTKNKKFSIAGTH